MKIIGLILLSLLILFIWCSCDVASEADNYEYEDGK